MEFEFQPDEALAHRLDEQDSLAGLRAQFRMPLRPDGRPLCYFTGNSLGLQPDGVAAAVQHELDQWARLGVGAHFDGDAPWFSYHELLREPLARLVGAEPDEVVAMNSLTVNLHLMLVSFFRPTPERSKILIEDNAFPSDTYAAQTQLRHHGHDPARNLIVARSAEDGRGIPLAEFERLLERHGSEIAVVLLGGVNYYTGQLFDMQRITSLAQAQGCIVGLDLAHAVGNVPLQLHDWNVDFAVWCSYKYLNAGPGAVAGCFVHRRHAERTDLSRFGGWWGNDPARRFRMHLESEFVPQPTADGWQLSNPPVLAMAPLRVALGMFDSVGMAALCAKSERLTAYLEAWVEHVARGRIELLTPSRPDERGCQISLRALDRPRELVRALESAGVVADFREPDVVRVAPVPLYNSFLDVWSFGMALRTWTE